MKKTPRISGIQRKARTSTDSKGKRGRPSKLNKAVAESIFQSVRNGMTYERAAIRAGVNVQTFRVWRRKGERDKPSKYRDFLLLLKEVETEAEDSMLSIVRNAAIGGLEKTKIKTVSKAGQVTEKSVTIEDTLPSWTAAMTWLERKFPSRWGKTAFDRLDPEDMARQIKESADALFGTVPTEPPAEGGSE